MGGWSRCGIEQLPNNWRNSVATSLMNRCSFDATHLALVGGNAHDYSPDPAVVFQCLVPHIMFVMPAGLTFVVRCGSENESGRKFYGYRCAAQFGDPRTQTIHPAR